MGAEKEKGERHPPKGPRALAAFADALLHIVFGDLRETCARAETDRHCSDCGPRTHRTEREGGKERIFGDLRSPNTPNIHTHREKEGEGKGEREGRGDREREREGERKRERGRERLRRPAGDLRVEAARREWGV